MGVRKPSTLSRREREIMDILFARGEATAGEVMDGLGDPPSYSAVRALLAVMEGKGHVKHRVEKGKYVYMPTVPRGQAAKSALARVLETFFGGSMEDALALHLADRKTKLTQEQYERLSAMIESMRRKGE
jgi:predicted transcriptional regulator